MGTSISYWTTHPVAPAIKVAVTSEARMLERDRRWWGQPIFFFDWEGKEQQLSGSSKPFGSRRKTADGREVDLPSSGDPADFELDWFMANREMKFICEQLARWSAKHDLTFEVVVEGESIGEVRGGQLAEELREWLTSMGSDFEMGWGIDEAADLRREQEAWARYPDSA